MNWTATLLRSLGNEALLIEKAEALQRELLRCFDERGAEEAAARLEALSELFSEDMPSVLELLEKISLYLCASCLVCGCLSMKCRELSARIVRVMLEKAPAREVFTGMTDGVSVLMERAHGIEFVRMVAPVMEMLPECVSGIARKRDRFACMSVQLMYRMAKKLREECSTMDGESWDISILAFLNAGLHLLSCDPLPSHKMMAFTLLVSNSLLSVLIWFDRVLETPLDALQCEMSEKLGPFLSRLGFQPTALHEAVPHMAEAWKGVEGDRDEESANEESTIEEELRCGGALLIWASMQSPSIPKLFTDDALVAIHQLLSVKSSVSDAACVLAALQMIPGTFMTPSSVETSTLLELCRMLVSHMEHHSVLEIKSQAAEAVSGILKSCGDDQRWQLLKELVFVPCADIAALMVQHLRSSVVAAWNAQTFHSVFASSQIFPFLQTLIQETDNDTLLEKAELYSAVLNLYLFLLVRESHQTTSISGVLTTEALSTMLSKLQKIREQIKAFLQEDEDEMRLQRLQLIVDTLLERLRK